MTTIAVGHASAARRRAAACGGVIDQMDMRLRRDGSPQAPCALVFNVTTRPHSSSHALEDLIALKLASSGFVTSRQWAFPLVPATTRSGRPPLPLVSSGTDALVIASHRRPSTKVTNLVELIHVTASPAAGSGGAPSPDVALQSTLTNHIFTELIDGFSMTPSTATPVRAMTDDEIAEKAREAVEEAYALMAG